MNLKAIGIELLDRCISWRAEADERFVFFGVESVRAYIGQGLRKDLARLERPELAGLEESLRRHGVEDKVIAAVLGEAVHRSA